MAEVSVRPARAQDAATVARLQLASWEPVYGDLLPAELLAAVGGEPGAGRWRSSVTAPPSPRHRVLVACAGPAVVGVAALGPAEDGDLDVRVDAEIGVLLVAPDARRHGHGSRLLMAAVDHLRGDGFERAYAWLPADDLAARAFLVGSGWAPDGAHRGLDLRGDGAVVVTQVRLHTDIRPAPAGAVSG
jgi:GNAT superfamily N-acetyltransferase